MNEHPMPWFGSGRDRRTRRRRRGGLIVILLVVLSVGGAVTLTSLTQAIQSRRQATTELQLEQTLWLLDAGKHLVVRRVADDPDYRGETWDVSPSPISRTTAEVIIRAVEEGSRQASRAYHIEAVIRSTDRRPTVTRRSDILVPPPTSES